jgi:HSP20 family protein
MSVPLKFRPHKNAPQTASPHRPLLWQIQTHSRWSPPTDFFETDEEYIVRVEVAGLSEQDFSVSFDRNMLTIRGTRQDTSARRAYHQMEIRYGEFDTSISLPGPIQIEGARAEYEDGFLSVILPKQPTYGEP